MSRLSCLVLALPACGVDVRTLPQDSEDPGVDGGAPKHDGGITTGDGARSDGGTQNLTSCEEAVYHSDFAFIQRAVFDLSCIDGCHGALSPSASMSLRAGASYGALVNVASTTHAGWVRVVPNNPGASMLMVQLGGEVGPPLEGLMPWNMPPLCVEKIDAIRRWIAAGALPQ